MKHKVRSRTALSLAGVMAAGGVVRGVWAAPADSAVPPDALEEIIVTAERREQNLQDVPVAVTALTEQQLRDRGITDYGQYLSSVPGASYADLGNQGNEVKFRGVGAGTQQLSPTTAVYLGDVPVIHTGRSLNSSYNFYLADMDRIELLRGPQGQLYGANSLGGAIKNVPNKARADAFSVSSQLTESTTHSPGGANYGGELTVNVPLIQDSLAVRVTGYGQRMSGWYDNVFAGGPQLGTLARYAPPLVQPPGPPGTPLVGAPWSYFPANIPVFHPVPPPGHISVLPNAGVLAVDPAAATYAAPANLARDVNSSEVAGTRLMLDWNVTERLGAELMATYEKKSSAGTGWAEEIPAKPNPAIPGTYQSITPVLYPSDAMRYQQINTLNAGNADEIFLANLQLNYKLDFATLTSDTSFWDRTETLQTDLSPIAFTVTQVNGTIPLLVNRTDNPRSFIQELRLTSPGGGALTWLAGAFYQRLNQEFHAGVDELSGLNIVYTRALVQARLTGTPIPPSSPFGSQDGDFTDEQLAGFGEIKYDILPSLNAGFSFRYIDLRQWSLLNNSGFFYFGQPNTNRSASERQFTPKYTLSWTPAKDELFYATASKGFRSGITNLEAPLSLCAQELANAGQPNGIQPTRPDTLWNYELGAKMSFADRRVTVDAAAYHIKWSNLQTQIILTNFFKPTPTQSTSACTYPAVFNVGDATIDGVEVEVNARLTSALHANLSFAHTNPRYESSVPQDNIYKGETIDGTPNMSGYAGLRYDLRLARLPLFAQADVTYVGHIVAKSTDFRAQAQPFPIGEYALVGARLGANLTDSLKIEAFIDNAFNRYAITRELDNAGSTVPTIFTTRPRTFGLTVRYGL
jgi:outer membrane receptor protein involved in Fe transport